MPFDLDTLLTEFDASSNQYAEAAAQYAQLKEWKHIVLATQMQIAETSGRTTAALMKRDALASKEYQQAVLAYCAAEENMLKLRLKLKCIEKTIDGWRTKESSARLERRTLNNDISIL